MLETKELLQKALHALNEIPNKRITRGKYGTFNTYQLATEIEATLSKIETEANKEQKIKDIKQIAYSLINDKWTKEKMRHLASTIYGLADGYIVGFKTKTV